MTLELWLLSIILGCVIGFGLVLMILGFEIYARQSKGVSR